MNLLFLLSCTSIENSEGIIIIIIIISELNSPCECIDAFDLVASEMLELICLDFSLFHNQAPNVLI